ncbi:MAG: hypothetical protein AAB866_01685 [Patescibacteria group bacterium]
MNINKGIALILIALIVAVVLGGGYAVVKTNPGLAKKLGMEKQAEKKEATKEVVTYWNSYTYLSTESGILPDITFRYPFLFGDKPTLISSRNTNRPERISDNWGGLVDFKSAGVLRMEFSKRTNSESSFESYVNKVIAGGGGWSSPKYFQAGNYKVARLRFSSPSHYDGDVGWYYVELSSRDILAISTGGDSKYLFDDDVNGNSTRDKIISTIKIASITTPVVFTNKEQKLISVSKEVLSALKNKDYQRLEGLVSQNGLSLGKEPNVDYINNLIAKNDVSEIPKDTKVYFWGYTDGKGDPINLTRTQFLTQYIYSGTVDFSKAPDVAVNKTLGKGNSFNTMDKAAQNGVTYVAFHFDGFDAKYAGMDWATIYLVFDSVNGEYKLRAIARDNWTI